MSFYKIIKIDATDSTNSLLRQRYLTNSCSNGEVLWTTIQRQGRGQRNTVWQSEAGKNLTFSIYKEFNLVKVHNPFMLSCLVSLGIQAALESLFIPNVHVKWPNDIMSGDKKVCGVLIENMFKGSLLQASIIGIGLNVNQENFKNLPKAASMFQISGTSYDLEDVLAMCLDYIQQKLELITHSEEQIIKLYEASLYRIGKPSTFQSNGSLFTGIIRGINLHGLLKVQLEDNQTGLFDLKTIKLKN
jgi:BirA family biotin operon repressor/biotin-[acetyl-CoA-carboxylase] ligase